MLSGNLPWSSLKVEVSKYSESSAEFCSKLDFPNFSHMNWVFPNHHMLHPVRNNWCVLIYICRMLVFISICFMEQMLQKDVQYDVTLLIPRREVFVLWLLWTHALELHRQSCFPCRHIFHKQRQNLHSQHHSEHIARLFTDLPERQNNRAFQ